MHTIESLKQTATLHIKRLSNLELTSDQTKRLATFASYLKWKRVLALAKKGITCVESIKAKYCALCSFYYNSYGDAEDLCQGCPIKELTGYSCQPESSLWYQAFCEIKYRVNIQSTPQIDKIEAMVNLLRTIYKSLLPSERKAKFKP